MTKNERAMLDMMVNDNDYNPTGEADVEVWTFSVCEDFGTSAGGIMASLTKKGWAGIANSPDMDDDRCWITAAGLKALQVTD